MGQGKSDFVQFTGEFELNEFKLAVFYCSIVCET